MRNFSRTVACAFALVASAASARAQDSMRDDELYQRWLQSSPEVASWRLQVGSARFDAVTAGLLPNPNLQFSITQLAAGVNTSSKTQYQAQLLVPLPIFGQVGKRVDAAEALVSVAEVNVQLMVWQRAGDIQMAMLDRAFAAARVEMLEKNMTELARIDQVVRTRTSAGANSEYEVLRVQTSSSAMRASLDNAKVARERAEFTILSLVGDPTLGGAPVRRESLASFSAPEDEAKLVAIALERRPDLELARRSAYANDVAASAWRRNAVPVPALFVGGAVGAGPEHSVYFTGGLSIDLPTFTRNQGAIGRAENDAESQRVLAKTLEARIRADVAGAWRGRQSAKQALEEYRAKGVPAAAELIKRAEITYQAGTFKITELFDAYQTVWEARAQELELERQMADAEAAVERACVLMPLRR